MTRSPETTLTEAGTLKLGELLQEFDERLGSQPEPEILTLTEKMGFVSQRERFNKRLAIADTSNYKLIGLNDIAFNPYLLWANAIAQNTDWKKAIISPLYPTFRVRKGYSARFVNYLLCSGYLRSRYGAISYGSVPRKRRATVSDFLNLPIPRQPSLVEQERIASLLDKADELRQLRAKADHRTAALIPALFHEMFGDPDTNPMGWDASPLGSLGTVVTGNTPPRSDSSLYGGFIEWVKTDNIDATCGVVGRPAEGLSEHGAIRGRVVPEGSVLITCIAGSIERIGDAAITDRRVAINQQINAIVPNKKVESAFLWPLVGALKPVIQANATGVMTRIINKSGLKMIPAISPPLPLQRQFAARVAEMRELEAAQAASRRRSDDLFQSLLHRAFQGEL
jgi:type I restriction enzyme, S subunit